MVAGFSSDYIKDTLSMKIDHSMLYFIIRRDGTLIIQEDGDQDANYFDKVRRHGGSDGTEERIDTERYIENLKKAMAAREEYTGKLVLKNERRRLYCKNLPYSEWYLILSVPYSTLDETIGEFGSQWTRTALENGIIIIALFMLVSAAYFVITRQQVHIINEARQMAERASSVKSEFLSNMSHDIRTPMNGIVGMTEIASADIENTGKVRDCLRKIALSSRHLLGLINDVLDMAKIESGKMILNVEQLSLPDIIEGVINIIQPQTREKNQRFDLHIHDIMIENVWGDSVRLNQILLNLLGNAVKFTPKDGKIQLELYQKPSEKGDAYVCVHLHVRDNGIGMSKEFQKKVFDSFVREDNARIEQIQGAGLGMSITKYIVDAMEGEILVESEKGRGSEFHVMLDMEKALVPEEEMEVPEWKTLIIDDDEIFCDYTIATLDSIGIHASRALDGNMALQMLEEEYQKGDAFQMILMDWRLPGMDGIEVTRQIRKKYGDEPRILMISACDNSDVEERAKEAGVDEFIVKPLFSSTLRYNLQKVSKETASETGTEEKESIDFSETRILVAEDIDLNWEIASALLSEVGLELERAENGRICVDMFSQSAAGYYQAILMDIRMPEMTGFEAAMAIRALDWEDAGRIPIIAMSADAFSDDVQKCLDCGMNAHVAKPIDAGKVVGKLKELIDAKDR